MNLNILYIPCDFRHPSKFPFKNKLHDHETNMKPITIWQLTEITYWFVMKHLFFLLLIWFLTIWRSHLFECKKPIFSFVTHMITRYAHAEDIKLQKRKRGCFVKDKVGWIRIYNFEYVSFLLLSKRSYANMLMLLSIFVK